VASQTFNGTAQSLFAAAVAWHVYELTGSALHLGGIGLAQFAPTLVLSLIGGAFADAHDRVRILTAQLAVMVLCGATLSAATSGGWMSVELAYAAVTAGAAASSFGNPAAGALLPNLVPIGAFPHAVALSSSIRQMARMSGPVLFGFFVQWFGLAEAYGLHVCLTLGAVSLLAFLRPAYGGGDRRAVSLESVREGVAFVRASPAILGAMSLDMVAVIFAGAVALLPIYARDILKVGPEGYGILAASLEVGTVGMGLLLVALPPMRRTGRAFLFAVAAFGLATIVFGLSRSYWLSVAAFAAAGAADQVSMVARSLIIQLSTPDALRGRVSSVNMVFIGASNQLGAAESGFLAWAMSPTFSVVFGGVACLAAFAGAARWVPALRDHEVDL